MSIFTFSNSKAQPSLVRGILWAGVFAWGVAAILDVIFELLPGQWQVVFIAALLGIYGILKLAPEPQKVRVRWTLLAGVFFAVWYILYSLFGTVDVDAILFHLNYDVGSANVQHETFKTAIKASFPFVLVLLSWNKLCRMSRGLAAVNRALPVGLLGLNPLIWVGFEEALGSTTAAPIDLQREYVDPRVSIKDGNSTKNLLHIFVESAEVTLWDERRFGDVAAPLKRVAQHGWSATGIAQIDLTGWTLAGQISSTCGIPLFSLGVINKNSFDLVDHLLPKAKCIGDVLNEQGYENVFIKGASLDFSGTRKFAAGHGYDRLLGFDELQPIYPDRFNSWGLHAEDMLEVAYEELRKLKNGGRPYSLTLTTVGGHAPIGYVSPICETIPFVSRQPNDTLKAFACTNLLVERFVKRLQAEGLLEQTVVVIQSDHLAMRNEVYGDLEASERHNMFVVLGAEPSADTSRPAATVDIFPTILTALGFEVAEGRAGLGRALQGTQPTIVEQFGIDGFNKAIDEAGQLRDRLWGLLPARS